MAVRSTLAAQLIWRCGLDAPRESCGLLASNGTGRITSIYAMRNVHEDPIDYFRMDDSELLETWGDIERRGYNVVAYYHSHVTTPAEPSEFDLQRQVPGLVSVIVSLVGDGDVRAWDGKIPYGGNLFD